MNSNLSPIMLAALKIIDTIRQQIIDGNCDEDDVAKTMAKYHPKTYDDDYINRKDYCNADKAMKMLGLGYNRKRFFMLTKKHHIINHTMNNQPIGFKISDIEKLKEILRNER